MALFVWMDFFKSISKFIRRVTLLIARWSLQAAVAAFVRTGLFCAIPDSFYPHVFVINARSVLFGSSLDPSSGVEKIPRSRGSSYVSRARKRPRGRTLKNNHSVFGVSALEPSSGIRNMWFRCLLHESMYKNCGWKKKEDLFVLKDANMGL